MNAVVHDIARQSERALHVREEAASSYGSDWKRVDARIVELGRERAEHEREVCRCLAEAERLGVPGARSF